MRTEGTLQLVLNCCADSAEVRRMAAPAVGRVRLRATSAAPLDAHSESELVGRLKGGDEAAVTEVFRRFLPKVNGVCLGILKNDAAAREAAHEALEEAVARIGQFDGRARFSTWLYRISANHAFMRLRKDSRRGRTELRLVAPEAENGRLFHVVSDAAPPDRELISADSLLAMERLCARLPEKYCRIVALCDFEDVPLPEAAAVLDLSVEAAKSRLHRGRTELRKLICRLGELCGPWCGQTEA